MLSLFLLLLLLLLLGFLMPSAISDPDDHPFLDCRPLEYTCGQTSHEIRYPFRLQGSPPYCGHPAFDLRCPGNATLLTTVGQSDYAVNSIDYNSQTVDLTDQNFASGACNTFTNMSFSPALFDYSGSDDNLTVYFNCSPILRPYIVLHNFSCFESEYGYQSFYALPGEPLLPAVDAAAYCDSVVVVPVDRSMATAYGMNLSAAALRRGFGLTWKAGDGWCKKCMDSKGICGNDPSSRVGGAACFCSKSNSINWSCESIRDATQSAGGKKISSSTIIVIIAVGAGFLLVCLTLALYFYKQRDVSHLIFFWKKDANNNQNVEAFLEEYGSLAPKRYSYSDVKKITKAFQEKLGQGGYGTVFKGTLSNGQVVAVKILKDGKSDGEEFINEVASIGRTFHVNVVSLLGFCSEGSKRALIYDFMCNGSLEKLLYPEKPRTTLDWEKLYEIVVGIARGLEYLHRGCTTRIVHFDIKPHNILLDEDFCPKISDFGLSKLCLKKESIISIVGARGTIGYIAPEVFSRNFGVVSSKSDVYSYGMMILEIAGGRKNLDAGVNNRSSEVYFPHWIYEHLHKHGDVLAYGVAAESEETVRKMILVGLWCIQTLPQNRPPMSRVIEMLEGSINDLQIPPKPDLSSSPLGSPFGTSSIQDVCWIDCSSSVNL